MLGELNPMRRFPTLAKLAALLGINQAAVVNSTSGASIDFTGLPAGVKRISIGLSNVSYNGAAAPLVQIGEASGGMATSGYASAGGDYVPTANHTSVTNGFVIGTGSGIGSSAAATISGVITLQLVDAATNTWVCSGVIARTDVATTGTGSGTKALSGPLDRVRITSAA